MKINQNSDNSNVTFVLRNLRTAAVVNFLWPAGGWRLLGNAICLGLEELLWWWH